jgi:hypothetical protein
MKVLLARLLCLMLTAWGASVFAAEWMDWSIAAELQVDSDDNVNIAPDDFERDDTLLTASASLGRALMFTDSEHSNTSLRWSADVSRRYYNDWSDLTRSRAGVRMQLHHKLGLGMMATRLLGGLSSHYEKVRDGDRDAWHHSFQLGLDKRFGPRLDLGLRAIYRLRDGEDWTRVDPNLGSDVYDSDHYELSLSSRYSLLPRLRWTLQASYYDGEFDSDCADLLEPGGGTVYGGGLANLGRGPVWEDFGLKALAEDQVFACRRLADGDGYGVRTDMTWSLSRNSSLKLRASYRDIELDLGQDYSNTAFGLSYRRRF